MELIINKNNIDIARESINKILKNHIIIIAPIIKNYDELHQTQDDKIAIHGNKIQQIMNQLTLNNVSKTLTRQQRSKLFENMRRMNNDRKTEKNKNKKNITEIQNYRILINSVNNYYITYIYSIQTYIKTSFNNVNSITHLTIPYIIQQTINTIMPIISNANNANTSKQRIYTLIEQYKLIEQYNISKFSTYINTIDNLFINLEKYIEIRLEKISLDNKNSANKNIDFLLNIYTFFKVLYHKTNKNDKPFYYLNYILFKPKKIPGNQSNKTRIQQKYISFKNIRQGTLIPKNDMSKKLIDIFSKDAKYMSRYIDLFIHYHICITYFNNKIKELKSLPSQQTIHVTFNA